MKSFVLKSAAFLILTCYYFTQLITAQTKDKRAEIELEGRIDKISLSPDNTIWLTSFIGKTYYSNDQGVSWNLGKPLFKQKDEYNYFAPQLERISFFNKDTAIMTGYIYIDENVDKNQYYLTKDGGKNWKLTQLNNNQRVNCSYTNPEGKAWLGGDEMTLSYSEDFGQTFSQISLPFQNSESIDDIYMINSMNGVLCAGSEILQTNDNWKSTQIIPTPFEQNKYQSKEKNNKISKIIIWKNHLVVKQNEKIYYTAIQNIDWKSFPIDNLIYFELNQQCNQLFVVSKNGDFFKLTTPENYELFAQNKTINYINDIKFINDSLLVLADFNELYKISKTNCEEIITYTSTSKIKKPFVVKRMGTTTLGYNGRHLYLQDDNKEWYREKVFDFYIHDLAFLNEKTILLWNTEKNTYSYSLEDKSFKTYEHHLPFKTFLEVPIESLIIESGNSGCFHHSSNEIIYTNKNNSYLEATKINFNEGVKRKKTKTFNHKTQTKLFTDILNGISLNPSKIPSLSDFKITDKDKKNYLIKVDSLLKNPETDLRGDKKLINKDFYYSIVKKLDTINHLVIQTILKKNEDIISTSSSHFTIKIINQKKDTISISRFYFENSHGWHLPWQIEYKGLHFECYNVEFSKFINHCLSKNFYNKEPFDNSVLIMEIADYLWFKENN